MRHWIPWTKHYASNSGYGVLESSSLLTLLILCIPTHDYFAIRIVIYSGNLCSRLVTVAATGKHKKKGTTIFKHLEHILHHLRWPLSLRCGQMHSSMPARLLHFHADAPGESSHGIVVAPPCNLGQCVHCCQPDIFIPVLEAISDGSDGTVVASASRMRCLIESCSLFGR